MMVYFDDLSWRAAGTLGWESNYLKENDTGPDDAVHSEYGCFALHLPDVEPKAIEVTIYDFAPTILELFGVKYKLRGKSIL
jgi:predicted AlkP superfamily phosphohydrolase/phosphomutase